MSPDFSADFTETLFFQPVPIFWMVPLEIPEDLQEWAEGPADLVAGGRAAGSRAIT